MASNELRQEVLKSFKKLHRTSYSIFKSNKEALNIARREINENYKKHKNNTDAESIKKLINKANEAIHILKYNIAEVEETTTPGTYNLKIRPEMFESVPEPNKTKV